MTNSYVTVNNLKELIRISKDEEGRFYSISKDVSQWLGISSRTASTKINNPNKLTLDELIIISKKVNQQPEYTFSLAQESIRSLKK